MTFDDHSCEMYLQWIIQAFSDKFISQMQSKIQVIWCTDKCIDELNTGHLSKQ